MQSCKHSSQKPQQTTPLQIRTRASVTGLWCVLTAADARSVCCTASNVRGVFLCANNNLEKCKQRAVI